MNKIGVLLLLYLLSVGTALAVRVTALYQGVLPATSQSATERNQLAGQALVQVLVKVSGNPAILTQPSIKAHLNSASSLMQEFSYSSASGQTKPYFLQLNFDEEGINSILRDAGAPIWGQNRPLLLVWLEYEVPRHPPEIIGADSGNPISVLLKQNTDRRGVPVIFPAMDVQDLGQVSIHDVAIMDIPKLLNATKRYAGDAMLMGRIVQVADGYNTQWKLIMGNDQWGWMITGKTIPDVLTTIADRVADTLAGRYATVITNQVQSNVTLKIVNVTEADDFVQVMNYIKHLTPVADVQLVQITGSDMILKVSLRGAQESFAEALSVGQKLTPVSSDKKQSGWVYQWNR